MKTKKQIIAMIGICLILHCFCPIRFNLMIGENNQKKEKEVLPSSVKQSSITTNIVSSNTPAISEEQKETAEPKQPQCSLDSTSCLIKDIALQYGIDWKIAVAISKWETGHYTSFAFKEYNNVGGMMYWDGSKQKMRLIQYSSLEVGIDRFISNLKNEYINKGLTDIYSIQKKYAPIGDNDDGTNSHWARGVSSIYNSLED